jgi:hypothetical protein
MLKRKKRYKHAIINKKKYYFYSIRWFDITGDAGHKTKDEMDKLPISKMVTQAYVFKKSKKLHLVLMMKQMKCLVIQTYFL